jgi:flagellar biosynthesis GTPase FlhF
MDESTTTQTDVRTFTGRSLDEILPQVRAELGADAIVVRRRSGLAGGVAGFFQRPFAEVEARRPLPDEAQPALRNDRATAEGLASPAIQALVEQATPFADALAHAEVTVGERAHEILAAAPANLYGPQPRFDGVVAPAPRDEVAVVPPRNEIAAPLGPVRPAAADKAFERLVASGLSSVLAEDVVAEAVTHGLPFAQPRALKGLVRSALARRLPIMAELGGEARTLAFVGPGGAGKTAAIHRLAAAYAAADIEVIVVALRTPDGGVGLANALEPLGVSVLAAADAEQARRRLARRTAVLTLIDTPAAGPGDRAAIAALSTDLRELGATEVHLTLPATLSAAAGDELAAALAPLGVTHVALTHADQTARPGAPVELALTCRRPLSYVATREEIAPADATDIARRLLP